MPNITPHPEDGIGDWTFEDFARSLTEGLDPEGRHYFPVYPYPFYTHMTSQDIVDPLGSGEVRSARGRPRSRAQAKAVLSNARRGRRLEEPVFRAR